MQPGTEHRIAGGFPSLDDMTRGPDARAVCQHGFSPLYRLGRPRFKPRSPRLRWTAPRIWLSRPSRRRRRDC